MSHRIVVSTAVLAAGFCVLASAAMTQPAPPGGEALPGAPAAPESPVPESPAGGTAAAEPAPFQPGYTASLFSPSRNNLLGDLYGLRSALGRHGITLELLESSEVFGNVTGGFRRGATYDGVTVLTLGLDTEKAFGWQGGTLNVSGLQIHGRGLSADNLGVLQTVTGNETQRATRLWELWYKQAFPGGKFDVKLGQQSADLEFLGSEGAGLFINSAMGWPVLAASDLYASGPSFPLASLGVRFRYQATDTLTLLGGVFDDNPAGGSFFSDSQVRGAAQSGSKFNLRTGALFIAEVQYAINQPVTGIATPAGPTAPGPTPISPSSGLPGIYKLGVWFDTARFPDQRLDTAGRSLADPASNGDPRFRRLNWSIYGVFDQTIWRPDPNQPRAVGVFARLTGAPGDRNLVNFSVNAGVTVKAPLPDREDDSFGVGFGLVKISPSATQFDRDISFFAGPYPIRSSETFIEVTYQALITRWWQIQPDFQYVFTPSGGVPNPPVPGKRIGNEAIFGLRSNVTF